MKILIIQENGRHEQNRNFRECFCLQRGFKKLDHQADVWGLGHDNYDKKPDFESYDLILNLENYANTAGNWVPSLRNVNTKKFLWSIDAHCRGVEPFDSEFYDGKYDLLLHSTKDYANTKDKIWFPNAYDDTLIGKRNVEKKCDVGFCGSMLNRSMYIEALARNYNFIHDDFVIGENMVKVLNSYKMHFNRNISTDINYRNFETIGCGIPLITNRNYQYELLGFKHEENVLFYSNIGELYGCINKLLNDEEFRLKIATSGFELAKKHTYTKRVEKLIEFYEVIK
jgi:hypothetical protein|tara:strand:- start:6077 stop:6928 length:852 start_codon:yes stop_codon:yes gene_type:complete